MTWPQAVFFSVLVIVGVPLGLWILTIWSLLLFERDIPEQFLMPWKRK
jgi:hypothetical protein